MDMPEYRSHKKVWAAEIKMYSTGKAAIISFNDCENITFTIEEFDRMTVRYRPISGDFLVKYADGYLSFSPRQAFLDGYTKL